MGRQTRLLFEYECAVLLFLMTWDMKYCLTARCYRDVFDSGRRLTFVQWKFAIGEIHWSARVAQKICTEDYVVRKLTKTVLMTVIGSEAFVRHALCFWTTITVNLLSTSRIRSNNFFFLCRNAFKVFIAYTVLQKLWQTASLSKMFQTWQGRIDQASNHFSAFEPSLPCGA